MALGCLVMNGVVVIPTLADSPWLVAAIASASAPGTSSRVILVCPPDRRNDLAVRHPGCEVVAETGVGLYGAINDGLRATREWEFFSYLNDDDLLLGTMPGSMPSGVDVLYGKVDYVDAGTRRMGSFPIETSASRIPRVLAAGLPALTPQGTWISRRAFEELGGFDAGLKYCGDFDFWLRAAGRGLRFSFRSETVGAFRLRPGQLSGQRAAADAELAVVCARSPFRLGAMARAATRLGFRWRHLGLIWERRRLTGRWRSRDLFAGSPS
ncbi:MAG TPA: hypothetical protein VGM73_07970 [Candidatus Didemnitutus sp.]|jgi:hypothetical protein